jgi:3',5'-cyclic AMP phosphodiesterase CpdA
MDEFENFQGLGRRDFVRISGKAGLTTMVASAIGINTGLVRVAHADPETLKITPFTFAIISDSHLFSIPDHKFDSSLADAVDNVNKLSPRPDFVVYCGDIGQNGRADQLDKGRRILSKLAMPIHLIPGEHDWYLDLGEAWRARFGSPLWSFDHKGVHFIGLNSILVRDFWTPAHMSPLERMTAMEMLESPIAGPWGIRDEGLSFLKKDVKNLRGDQPVVVFTHGPLWDYYPRWNFQTEDAPEIRAIMSKFKHVMAFHGHVHQSIYNRIGNLCSVGSLSTSWPWPYPAVELPYPEVRMNRLDPVDSEDGMGTQHIDLMAGFKGKWHWDPFREGVLQDAVKNGVGV